MEEPSVLIIGSTRRKEFGAALECLEQGAAVERCADVAAAQCRLAGGAAPELIVLAQSRPGEFAAGDVEELRASAPLARVVSLLGSWCEGEMRSGQPTPGAQRLYWHQSTVRLSADLVRREAGDCPTWGLPLTAADDERLLLAGGESIARSAGLVAICSPHWEMADWLADTCRLAGYATLWQQPGRAVAARGVDAVIWDGCEAAAAEIEELAALVKSYPEIPIVALLDFPRIEQADRVQKSGASAVLSKPLLAGELAWQLDRLISAK